MKRQKMKVRLLMMWLIIFIFLGIFIWGVVPAFFDGQDISIGIVMFGGIIAWLLVSGLRSVKRCYIEMGNGQLVVVRTVKKLKPDNATPEGKWIKKTDIFDVKDIVRMGYSCELYRRRLECQRDIGGKLYDTEVVFELKNQEKIAVNMAFFSPKQFKEIFSYVHGLTGIWPEGRLMFTMGKKIYDEFASTQSDSKQSDPEAEIVKRAKLRNQYDVNNRIGKREEMDTNLLYLNKLQPLPEEKAEKYRNIWIERIRAKRWKLSLLLCTPAIPLVGAYTLLASLNSEMRNAPYMMVGILLPGIIGFIVLYQMGAKSKVVSFKVTPYERGLCIIIEYTGKDKPIYVQYVKDGEIIEEYLNENSVCGELQVGQYATLIMVKDAPEHLLCQDISWAGM